MAYRHVPWLWLLIGSLCLQRIEAMTVSEIAANLRLNIILDQNYYPKPERYLFHMELRNVHPTTSIESGDWAIFFTSNRMLEIDDLVNPGPLPNPEGVPLADSGFQLYHVDGRLFKMQLLGSANKPLMPGEPRNIPIHGNLWIIARTDFTPNVYVASLSNDTDVAVIPNTADWNRRFVAPFMEERQYKRIEDDTFAPYTLTQRDQMYEVTDLAHDNDRVIPNPLSQTLTAETVHISRTHWVIFNAPEVEFEAQYLHEKIEIPRSINKPSEHYIQLAVDPDIPVLDECQGSLEAYKLEINSGHVLISAPHNTGVFYGVQTFLQLLDADGSIHQGTVEDCPLFPYRGVMIDPARHFVPKEEVLRLIEAISRYKINKLHLHLTDDDGWRIEIPAIPELTTIAAYRCHDLKNERCILPTHGSPPTPEGPGSGFYSVEDYKEILQFAANRHVEVIPEIDVPGHSHAAVNAMLARYRRYNETDKNKASQYLLSDFQDTTEYLTVQMFSDSAVNPCIESTYTFVEAVMDALIDMHRGIQDLKVFHFGGDEVPGAWEKSPACKNLIPNEPFLPENATTRDFVRYFAREVGQIAGDKGLDLAGWEDGLQFAEREELTVPFPIDDFRFNDNVYAYQWFNIWEDLVGGGSYRFANYDYKAIIAHATHFYYDFPSEPDPEERGSYWGSRATDTKRSFFYATDDIYRNIDRDRWGNPLTREQICNRDADIEVCPQLNPAKADNLVGIQCLAWAETITTPEHLENMLFPRILAMAERAWSVPDWYNVTDEEERRQLMEEDWVEFANAVGYRELESLESLGIRYHIRPPATRWNETNSEWSPFGEFPGTPVLASEDSGMTWVPAYPGMKLLGEEAMFIARSIDGTRTSRSVKVQMSSPTSSPPAPSPCSGMALRPTTAVFLATLLILMSWIN